MTPIQGSIKEADYVAAQRLHIKPRPVLAVVGILLLVLAVALLIYKLDWELLLAPVAVVSHQKVQARLKAALAISDKQRVLSDPVAPLRERHGVL